MWKPVDFSMAVLFYCIAFVTAISFGHNFHAESFFPSIIHFGFIFIPSRLWLHYKWLFWPKHQITWPRLTTCELNLNDDLKPGIVFGPQVKTTKQVIRFITSLSPTGTCCCMATPPCVMFGGPKNETSTFLSPLTHISELAQSVERLLSVSIFSSIIFVFLRKKDFITSFREEVCLHSKVFLPGFWVF